MHRRPCRAPAPRLLALAAGLCATGPAHAAAAPPPTPPEITRAIDVRSLSLEEAQLGRPARLRGVVTFIEGPNAIFLQDETAGSYFNPAQPVRLQPGDLIEVTGITKAGNYLPGLNGGRVRVLGRAPLPAAPVVNYEDLVSGRFHYQWVAIEGIARSVSLVGEGRSLLRVDLGLHLVEVWIDAVIEDEAAVVDSRVRVEGLAAGGINQRRQLVQPYLRTLDRRAIRLLQAAPPEHRVPRLGPGELATFHNQPSAKHRVRVGGSVTAAVSKQRIFVRDGETAFELRFHLPTSVEVGDRIEALGFTEMGRFSATVVDARLVARAPGPHPPPVDTDLRGLLTGTHDSDLVTLTARLTQAFRTSDGVTLALQQGAHSVSVRAPFAAAPNLLPGTLVRVTGICEVESNTIALLRSRPQTVALLARGPEDVVVLQRPPWWTSSRLTTVLIALAGLTLAAGLWISALRRQVRRQTEALRRRLQSEAALDERQRIAREFHDSLAQDLTGLALRLDAATLCTRDEKAQSILDGARALLARVQTETRNLVADLRTPAERTGDLAAALEAIAAEASEPGGAEVRVEFSGPPPHLPPATLHHLRMIARESVANARQHARPREVVIEVATTPEAVHLRIRDDGAGFSPEETHGTAGHFGCVGIRERTRKLGGRVEWRSTPEQGTAVEVTIPRPVPETAPEPEAAAVP